MRTIACLFAVACVSLLGCEDAPPQPAANGGQGTVQSPPAPPSPVANLPVDPTGGVVPATDENIGRKGRNYGGGIITEPLSQHFRVQDRLKLMQIKQAIQLYNGFNGKNPATHEEFMEGVMKANNLTLPEAHDPNMEVFYDPNTAWLALRPKGSGAGQ